MAKLGRKLDKEKPLWNLLPLDALEPIVNVLTFGAKKYAPNNWKHVKDPKERYFAALIRHLVAYRGGESHDKESGEHHLAHAGSCLLFLLWFECVK